MKKISELANAFIGSMLFTDAGTGYVTTVQGQIFKSSNGGISWKLIYSNTNSPISKIIETQCEQALPVKNPFNENDNKKITPQDLESEQEFKEAQTERD